LNRRKEKPVPPSVIWREKIAGVHGGGKKKGDRETKNGEDHHVVFGKRSDRRRLEKKKEGPLSAKEQNLGGGGGRYPRSLHLSSRQEKGEKEKRKGHPSGCRAKGRGGKRM